MTTWVINTIVIRVVGVISTKSIIITRTICVDVISKWIVGIVNMRTITRTCP